MPANAGLIPYDSIDRREVEWVVPGLVPAGMLTVLAGPPKVGKSLLYCAWAATLAGRGFPSVLVNAEDSPAHTTKPRLEALEADTSKVFHCEVRPSFGNGTTEAWLGEIGQWIINTSARLLIFDPLAAFIDGHADTFRDHHVRALVLEPLDFLAQTTGCAIIYVKHFNKGGSDSDPLARIADSIAFTAGARSVIGVAKIADKPMHRYVAQIASNVSETMPPQLWRLEPIFLTGHPKLPDVRTARLVFERTEDTLEMQTLWQRFDDEDKPALELAKEIIEETLATGGVPSKDLERAVKEAGISLRTGERARRELGVRAYQQGRNWYSRLPVTSQTAKAQTANELGGLTNLHGSEAFEEDESSDRHTHAWRSELKPLSQSPPDPGTASLADLAAWYEDPT